VATWRRARREGHEIGNHSRSHLPGHGGRALSVEGWLAEIRGCSAYLAAVDVAPPDAIAGFRAPYLEYHDATLAAVTTAGLRYDCSIEEGFEPGQDGGNAFWPYTLDGISPGHATQPELPALSPHPGLWELPVPAVFVPPDDRCAAYGVPPGLRAALKERQQWFDAGRGAITGFDFNLWARRSAGGFEMTAAEFLATLLFTVDQRLRGNRAPLLFGSHSACYVEAWNGNAPGAPRAADRRAAIEALLDAVAAKPEARIRTHGQVLDWMRAPSPL
jgi:Polysaccharide deacetylase